MKIDTLNFTNKNQKLWVIPEFLPNLPIIYELFLTLIELIIKLNEVIIIDKERSIKVEELL